MAVVLNRNEREIIPVGIWQNGTTYNGSILKLTGYCGYDFLDNFGFVSYAILYVADGDILVQLLQGTLPLTSNIWEDWCADDSSIFTYVAGQLNLTLI